MTTPRWIALAALVAVAALWWGFARGVTATAVLVETGGIAEVVYATGTVEPEIWAKVSAPARKRIVELCKCEGQPVAAGDVLVKLDDTEERAALTELEARVARLRDDASRLERLVERNAVSVITLEEKLTQVREYEARIAAQKDRIEDLALKSPIDGIVLSRDGEVGEIAGTTANDVLLWVGEPRPLQIVSEINEDDIARVRPGQKVLLRHEGHRGAPLEASVSRIRPKGDATTKTFRAYLSLPDDTPLLIGMSVEANIIVREAANVKLVPAEAIGGGKIEVVENGRVARRPVTVGIRGTNLVEITGDVESGTTVLSPFRPDLADGSRVRAVIAGPK